MASVKDFSLKSFCLDLIMSRHKDVNNNQEL
jgi:hypothetical protein